MKKISLALSLLIVLAMGAQASFAANFCPEDFDTSLSFSENLNKISEEKWIWFKEVNYSMDASRAGQADYSLGVLGYYQSSANGALDVELRIDRQNANPNLNSADGWFQSQSVSAGSFIDLLIWDDNSGSGVYERFTLSDIIASSTVYQLRTEYAYVPVNGSSVEYDCHTILPNPPGSAEALITYYIFAFEYEYMGNTLTYFFELREDLMRSAVPVPGAALLLGTGLAGVLGLRRRTGRAA